MEIKDVSYCSLSSAAVSDYLLLTAYIYFSCKA